MSISQNTKAVQNDEKAYTSPSTAENQKVSLLAVAALTYLLTVEPTASFWDCPEFISQGAKLEVGHPPGNPIFMLAARFFVTLFAPNYT